METISLAIEFVSSQGSGASDISAQTCDVLSWNIFLFVGLFCVFGFVGYCCWKKKAFVSSAGKNSGVEHSAKHSHTSKLSEFSNVLSQKWLAIIISIVLSVFVILCMTINSAYADVKNQSLTPDTDKITATVSEDGSISFSSCNLKNTSSTGYTLSKTSVSVTNEAKSVAAVNTAKIEIGAFGGCIFSGVPDGSEQAPTGISGLIAGDSTPMSFAIDGLDKESALALCGKNVYSISMTASQVYSVTYEKGVAEGSTISGEVPVDSKLYAKGDTVYVKDQATLSCELYDFDGWAIKDGSKIQGSYFIIQENTILIAQWKAKTLVDLSGVARFGENKIAAGAQVYFTYGDIRLGPVTADENGIFKFKNVPEGVHGIIEAVSAHGTIEGKFEVTEVSKNPVSVTIDTAVENPDFVSFKGVIKDDKGTPVEEGSKIYFVADGDGTWYPEGEPNYVTVGKNGEYEFIPPLPKGVSGELHVVSADDTKEAKIEFDVPEQSGSIDEIDVEPKTSVVEITGTAKDSEGNVLPPGTKVRFVTENGDFYEGVVDENGQFIIKDVPGGLNGNIVVSYEKDGKTYTSEIEYTTSKVNEPIEIKTEDVPVENFAKVTFEFSIAEVAEIHEGSPNGDKVDGEIKVSENSTVIEGKDTIGGIVYNYVTFVGSNPNKYYLVINNAGPQFYALDVWSYNAAPALSFNQIISSDTLVTANLAETPVALDRKLYQYTPNELKTVSDYLAELGDNVYESDVTYKYFKEFVDNGILEDGSDNGRPMYSDFTNKVLNPNAENHWAIDVNGKIATDAGFDNSANTTIQARIVGIRHDTSADNKINGLTFMTTHALSTTSAYESWNNAKYGWGGQDNNGCTLQTFLNGNNSLFPAGLDAVVKSAKKGYESSTDDSKQAYTIINKYWAPSMYELYGQCSTGSWPNNNEGLQYGAFINKVSEKVYSVLSNIDKYQQGNEDLRTNYVGSRSLSYNDAQHVCTVSKDGLPYPGNAASANVGVVACFCIGTEPSPISINGVAKFSENKVAAGAKVSFTYGHTTIGPVVANADGSFVINNVPVGVSGKVKAVSKAGTLSGESVIASASEDPVSVVLEDIVEEGNVTFQGKIFDRYRYELGGAKLYFVADDGTWYPEGDPNYVTVNWDGSYEFSQPLPKGATGTLHVISSDDSKESLTEFTAPSESGTVVKDIIVNVWDSWTEIKGIAIDADGTILPKGAKVRFLGDDGVVYEGEVGDNGQFEIEGVPGGLWGKIVVDYEKDGDTYTAEMEYRSSKVNEPINIQTDKDPVPEITLTFKAEPNESVKIHLGQPEGPEISETDEIKVSKNSIIVEGTDTINNKTYNYVTFLGSNPNKYYATCDTEDLSFNEWRFSNFFYDRLIKEDTTITARFAKVYEIKLNAGVDAKTPGTTTIYEKYDVGWYADKACNNRIDKINLPTKEKWSFEGYNTDENIVIDNWGNISVQTDHFSESTELDASWEEALDYYSWEEINEAANDISELGESSRYYNQYKKFAERGQTKVLKLGDDDDADRLFMRIIGINHDDIANTTNKAGLTFMAANSINDGFYYENDGVGYSQNWGNSELRYNLNEPGQDSLYGQLSEALVNVHVSPVHVSKQYAYAFEGAFGERPKYNYDIAVSRDTFFLPSYYEITGEDWMFGTEGNGRYEYIDSDIWQQISDWNYHWFSGPLMNSVNWKGYLWLQNEGKANLQKTIDVAFSECYAAGGCVDFTHCDFPDYVYQRSLYNYTDDSSMSAMSLSYDSDAYYHNPVNARCCVAPCFCLGGQDGVNWQPLQAKSGDTEHSLIDFYPSFDNSTDVAGYRFAVKNHDGLFTEIANSVEDPISMRKISLALQSEQNENSPTLYYYKEDQSAPGLKCYTTIDKDWDSVFAFSGGEPIDYPAKADMYNETFQREYVDRGILTAELDSHFGKYWDISKTGDSTIPILNNVLYFDEENGFYNSYSGLLSYWSNYPWGSCAENENYSFFFNGETWSLCESIDPDSAIVLAKEFGAERSLTYNGRKYWPVFDGEQGIHGVNFYDKHKRKIDVTDMKSVKTLGAEYYSLEGSREGFTAVCSINGDKDDGISFNSVYGDDSLSGAHTVSDLFKSTYGIDDNENVEVLSSNESLDPDTEPEPYIDNVALKDIWNAYKNNTENGFGGKCGNFWSSVAKDGENAFYWRCLNSAVWDSLERSTKADMCVCVSRTFGAKPPEPADWQPMQANTFDEDYPLIDFYPAFNESSEVEGYRFAVKNPNGSFTEIYNTEDDPITMSKIYKIMDEQCYETTTLYFSKEDITAPALKCYTVKDMQWDSVFITGENSNEVANSSLQADSYTTEFKQNYVSNKIYTAQLGIVKDDGTIENPFGDNWNQKEGTAIPTLNGVKYIEQAGGFWEKPSKHGGFYGSYGGSSSFVGCVLSGMSNNPFSICVSENKIPFSYNVYGGDWWSYEDEPSGVVLAREFGGADPQLNLEDYSWEEINAIGKDISNNGNESDYYEQFEKFAEEGQTKTLMLGEGDNADRLFMRIIGINHDTIANSTDKAGLTFMAANAINKPYTFEDSTATKTQNWACSALRNNMNTSGTENDQTIYDLLSVALDKVKISPLLVDKPYALGYEDETSTTYSSDIKSSADYFFIPSFYEISNDSGMGLEGSKYKFINSDIWQSLAHKWREGENVVPEPIMNAINWKGYLWFQSEEGQEYLNKDIDTAFDSCEKAGGCVACTLNWSLWTRSVWPQFEGKYANAMSIYGDPKNYYQVSAPMCVAPCFCLGGEEVPDPPQEARSLLVHDDNLGDLMYAPVFPDGNPPEGFHFYTLTDNKYIEIKPSDPNAGLKMSDLAQAVKDKNLYYINEGNNALYAVRSAQVDWNTINTKDNLENIVNEFDDTCGLRDLRTCEQTGYCDPDYWCGLDWRNSDNTGPSENTTIYYNKNNIYSTSNDKVNIGVEVGSSSLPGSVFAEYDGFINGLYVFGMQCLWSCIGLQNISSEELNSNSAYFWNCNEGKWLTEELQTNGVVVFSRAFH